MRVHRGRWPADPHAQPLGATDRQGGGGIQRPGGELGQRAELGKLGAVGAEPAQRYREGAAGFIDLPGGAAGEVVPVAVLV